MAFTTGKQRITPNRGTDAYLIMWDQPDGWDRADSNGNFKRYNRLASIDSEDDETAYIHQPQASNLGIVRQGTTIDANYFDQSPIASKQGDGPGTVTGDLSMNVSGNGTAQILRNVLQVQTPAMERKGSYTDTSILSATTATGSVETTVFTDDLTDVLVPVPVIITLASSPSVNSGVDHATITIGGKDRNGRVVNSSITWTPAEITAGTLTKTTKVHFSEIDNSEPNEFAAGTYALSYLKPPIFPVVDGANLRATEPISTITDTLETGSGSFGEPGRSDTTSMPVYVKLSSPVVTAGTFFGWVYITGTDERSRPVTDAIRFQNNSTDLTRTKRSSVYFKTITRVVSEGFSSGTYDATAINEAAKVTFEPSTRLPAFVTLEVGKTVNPNTYRNVIFNSTSFNFGRTDPVRVTSSVVGGEAELGYNATEDRTGPFSALEVPTNRDRLLFTSDDVFSGWQCEIKSGNLEFSVESATLTVNHNIAPSELLGSQYPTSPPSGSDKREIILTLELQSDNENDFRELFQNNLTLNDVTATLTNTARGAYKHQLIFECPRVQITEDPDYVVSDFGIVGQTLSLRAIKEANFDYEIRAIAEYSVWYPVKTFN